MDPIFLCDAVEYAAPSLYKPIITKNNAHVKSFQDELYNYLSHYPILPPNNGFTIINQTNTKSINKVNPYINNNPTSYTWYKEYVHGSIPVSDAVDVMGISNKGNYKVVIEIDAWRADQVAKKFLSRSYLYSIEGRVTNKRTPIQYVAILYKQNTSSLTEALKYIHYANKILKNLNRLSSCTAILVYDHKIVYYDPNQSLRFRVNNSNVITGMPQTAKYAVDLIAPNVNYNGLQSKLGAFVSNTQKNRMIKCNNKTYPIYVEHEWEKFGPSANWDSFVKAVKDCKKWKSVQIVEQFNHYQNKKLNNWFPL